MLEIAFIKENKNTVLKGLEVKRFKNAEETLDQVIQLDEAEKIYATRT